MPDMSSIEEVAQQVRNCTDCPLGSSRTNAVPGEGPDNAQVFFIGEGPGYQEDRQGRPFVGPAGGFLDALLSSIGLNREDVFIANMVKCRPPNNRDPLPAEIEACSKYLDRQLELINPRLVVTLGRFSMSKFLPRESISRARGKVRRVNGLNVYPIMHPAAALHRQELRKGIEEDFKGIPDLLAQQDEPVAVEEKAPEKEEVQPQQLNLF